ncbi:hypothetical protein FISHEDRAFT_46717 [Fistulina hepatica ATCC 64428]|uniref:BTB domain-containing protein n=1 Tax=Fistulina hepatica ATCC 64428 TaxID=1128425 RepID=A0A0D7A6U4_9AGAR|nr:hypothetical protein FISHEDRAFT_46717 [Fistulina hepatica ATCC 64428]
MFQPSFEVPDKKRKRDDSEDSARDASRPATFTAPYGGSDLGEGIVDDETPEIASGPSSKKKARVVVRDDKYYFEDGSCILQVEDTLFNVHRTILSKDNSSFSTMFSLPQGEDNVGEGKSDDNPIVLAGDTVSEFRHFLWALYALPPELRVVTSADADLTQLIDIARVSNKYFFKSLETWSLDAIQEYVGRKPCPILTTIPPPMSYSFTDDDGLSSTAQLTRLVRLAQMCSHDRLMDTMIALLRSLMSSSLQYAYLAMTLADELDIRALRGSAYLEVMQKSMVVKRTKVDVDLAAKPTSPDQPFVINPAQQLRLLSGYYRLTRTWERLRVAPPHFEHSASCGATWHQHGCTQSWLEFWKDKTRSEAVLSFGMADCLGRLKLIAKDYDRWGSATYMHHDCRLAARRSISEVIKSVEEALPDYFSDSAEDC